MKNRIIISASIICFIIAFLCFIISAKAQVNVVNNGSTIGILTGTTVFVNGNLTQQSAATINNEGMISLTQNFTNNAGNNCFGTSTGLVVMNGGVQTIGGTSPTTFNDLLLQGTGTKFLTQNISTGGGNAIPAGTLNLLTRLDLNSNTLSVTNPATNAITGTGRILSERTDNSSKVKWTINNTTGAHIIPFENAGSADILFTFNLTSGNAGDVTVSTYVTSAANLPLPVLPVPVSNINNNFGINNSNNMVDRFWQVDATGNPTANLTFSWSPLENAAAGNINPVAQRWTGAALGWDLPVSGQSNPSVQSVLVNNVTSFGPWAISLSSSPLPIELLTFDAKLNSENMVDLFWATATEINNDYFTMERSADGKSFESIGIVDGAGNSSRNINYLELDKNPLSGISYYRLKQTDFDGKFTYSQIVSVEMKKDSKVLASMNIYPNPAIDLVNIQVSDESVNPNTKVEIFNAIGQVVFSNTISNLSSNNNHVYQVSTGSFSSGFYMVRMMNGDEVVGSQKLIKK